MNDVYLLTGGNMGDRVASLKTAIKYIEKRIGAIKKKSSIYETAAWGLEEQPAFLNQVLYISTALPAVEVLNSILDIENDMGRKRIKKLGPRVIDIDILFYKDEIVNTTELIIPHPEIAKRKFALVPLNEIAPDLQHPVLKTAIKELLKFTDDKLLVRLHDND